MAEVLGSILTGGNILLLIPVFFYFHEENL